MLVLLPPSEGKTAPARGAPVDLTKLSSAALTGARERVLDRLVEVSARDDAPDLLGVGAGVADEVRHNTGLRTAPAAPAARVYSGVLFAAAGLPELTGTARRRAAQCVRIFSGLWGVLEPSDRVPAYRLSMGAALPGLPGGKPSAFWRAHLAGVLDERASGDVVVDCRSAAYAAAWKPPRDCDHVTVQVVREDVTGQRQVVSHNAKHARGLLTHHLLTRTSRPPRTAERLAEAAQEMVDGGSIHAVELGTAVRGRRTLTLVERG
ncbi:peroxide stress protein YaaA [Georgenia halophila]|uniref:Peroxide stress protein YaaA n=1 Tax=Georgenia halophila TaxID=620889 RepID=A0ABP8LPW2_9MICO